MQKILEIDEEDELEFSEDPRINKWNDRSQKISDLIGKIKSGEKTVMNPEKIILYLSFVLITLDLAIGGDEQAIAILQNEAGIKYNRKPRAKKITEEKPKKRKYQRRQRPFGSEVGWGL